MVVMNLHDAGKALAVAPLTPLPHGIVGPGPGLNKPCHAAPFEQLLSAAIAICQSAGIAAVERV
jgi:hypothetical protein